MWSETLYRYSAIKLFIAGFADLSAAKIIESSFASS
jgi:hypothetical protein